ncbi:MAG: hypothetical protein KDF58_09835 [Alphaproteobacteria bacterium]|nr:hypothetical protein [Alphaproteobacteria bacterium]HPF46695.1 FliH/SctL family protein [Emcibacteraceae bacterium]HRW29208.1 FliH/SctL family protein [Emcibacteraceae bacterium]
MESVKFTFDDDFSADAASGGYSSKMQSARDEAFVQGKEQGYSESLGSIEKSCEIILEDIRSSFSTLLARHEEQVAAMEKSATALVLTIIQKLAPAIVSDKPIREIENLVEECLRNNPTEPRMVIRVDEKMLPLLRKKIDAIKTSSDYNGQIVLISDTMSNISDCKVEWIDGGAERDFDGLMKSIEEAVQIFIDAPSTTENNVDRQRSHKSVLDDFPET